jgi:hypothetical protein
MQLRLRAIRLRSHDPTELPPQSRRSRQAGYAFVTLKRQNGPDLVQTCAPPMSRKLEGPLYDVGLFNQINHACCPLVEMYARAR